MLSIVTLFYTYSGVLGYTIDAINITIYYISLIIMLIVKNRLIKSKKFASKTANAISLLYLFIMALFFIFFTYNPPSINLFVSPV